MYLIAEIGVNHNGDVNLAREMIRAASENGANAVKFQVYNPDVVFKNDKEAREWAHKCRLSEEDRYELHSYAKDLGLDYGVSIFDNKGLEIFPLRTLDFLKIASRTVLHDYEFTRHVIDLAIRDKIKVIASMNNELWVQAPCIVPWRERGNIPSSLTTEKDIPIEMTHPELFREGVQRLYCVSSYPSEVHQYALVPYIFKNFDDMPYCQGLSDHTLGIGLCLTAIAHGATIIEKHFTLDKSMPGPDQVCSMTPDELRHLRRYGDEIERIRNQLDKPE